VSGDSGDTIGIFFFSSDSVSFGIGNGRNGLNEGSCGGGGTGRIIFGFIAVIGSCCLLIESDVGNRHRNTSELIS